ncbi:unnamed protein product [Caenorhabditis auriculariae]|uniref:Apple domain-containing protein n=1 Tax=Caenorhabditis auriculariae TaxID=2777116 RepID=A0A8S1HLF4_9PELO|nr:unnamed protein product [Caenorhabditis auriculariae]
MLVCNLFNVTTDDVVVKGEFSGDVIWLMLNYNLTSCGSLEDIQMIWSKPYCQTIVSGAIEPMLHWKIDVDGNEFSARTISNGTLSCGGYRVFPQTSCADGLHKNGFSYNTICNLFNATTDDVLVKGEFSGDVIWLMLNYNLTSCGPLEDILSKPYCQTLEEEAEPMLHWIVDVNGNEFSARKVSNDTLSCGGLRKYPLTSCMDGLYKTADMQYKELGFSYKTVCNLFNATTDNVSVTRKDSGDVIWLIINYNLTTCGSLEDVDMILSKPYCQTLEEEAEPMLHWIVDVNGNEFSARTFPNDTLLCGGVRKYPLTSCMDGLYQSFNSQYKQLGSYTGVSPEYQYQNISSEDNCKTLCQKKRGCWGFSYSTTCNLFNATTDNVVVKKEDSGDVIWLMLNYNLTSCGSLEDIEMIWSKPYCQSLTCGVYKPVLQWKISVENDKFSAITSPNETIYCGGMCFWPKEPCESGYRMIPQKGYADAACLPEPIGFSYTTICNIFNATADTVVVNRDYSSDIIWLMINYNITTCTSLEDVEMTWSKAYCQSLTCGVYLPVVRWKIIVDNDKFRAARTANGSVSCAGVCYSEQHLAMQAMQ